MSARSRWTGLTLVTTLALLPATAEAAGVELTGDIGGSSRADVPAATCSAVVSKEGFEPWRTSGLVVAEGGVADFAAVRVEGGVSVAAVASDRDAIGHGGVARGPDLVHCSVDGVPPDGWARRFVDWCQGGEGQRVVAEVGYLPPWPRPSPPDPRAPRSTR